MFGVRRTPNEGVVVEKVLLHPSLINQSKTEILATHENKYILMVSSPHRVS